MNFDKLLVQAAKDCFDTEARSYSGRGMYGKTCLGVDTGRHYSPFRLCAALASWAKDYLPKEELYSFLDHLEGVEVSQDSMGLGSIVYFPSVPWVEDEEGEE